MSGSPTASIAVGAVTVTHRASDPSVDELCVRPDTVVTILMRPRPGVRWTSMASSAPRHATVTGWRTDSDGTAHATVTGRRTGTTLITVRARPSDAAAEGADIIRWTLRLTVEPYATPGDVGFDG